MRTVFADACYFIGLLNPKDQRHEIAKDASKRLEKCRIVTSEMVLAEVLNGLSRFGPQIREKAVQVTKTLLDNPNVDVVPQTGILFKDALEHYSSRKDKDWSLTDCASFLIMTGKNISEAVTNDHHFEQSEFIILMKDKS